MAADIANLRPFPYSLLVGDAVVLAPRLLNCVIATRFDGQEVAVRLTELEAYRGVGQDPGSHAFRRMTDRNATMFGPPGHLYVYQSYGVHWCGNIVVGQAGSAGGVLLRGGEVIVGQETAWSRRERRGTLRLQRDLARGPGRLGTALGLRQGADGARIGPAEVVELFDRTGRPASIAITTRTGVAGLGSDAPFRFYLEGDPTVSPHRPAKPKGD